MFLLSFQNVFIFLFIYFSLFHIIYSQSYNGEFINSNCYLPFNRKSCAPQFIIIGSMKCGTTSLYSYLLNHPQVLPIKVDAKLNGVDILASKEVRFFMDPTYNSLLKKKGYEEAMEQYLNIFPEILPSNNTDDIVITGEASPMYVCTKGISERIYKLLPYGKLIWLMRNPIDRAYSDYWFRNLLSKKMDTEDEEKWYNETKNAFTICARTEIEQMRLCKIEDVLSPYITYSIDDFNTCMKSYTTSILSKPCNDSFCVPKEVRKYCKAGGMMKNGIYVLQALEYFDIIPHNQLLVLQSEEFYSNTEYIMDNVTDFLQIQNISWNGIVDKAFNIVNPSTKSSEGRKVSSISKGLGVGMSDHDDTMNYPQIDDEVRQELEEFYNPFNELLKSYVGFSW